MSMTRDVQIKVDIQQGGGLAGLKPTPNAFANLAAPQNAFAGLGDSSAKSMMRDVQSSFETSFTNLRNIGSALQTIASSSAPNAMQTLSGSVQLLAGEVTGIFLPAIMTASHGIQSLADKIRHMDEASKGALSHLAETAGPLVGAAIGLSTLATMANPLMAIGQAAISGGPAGMATFAVGAAAAGGIAGLASTDKGRDALASLAEALTPLVSAFDQALIEMRPAIDDLAQAVKDMAPMVKSLAELVGEEMKSSARVLSQFASFNIKNSPLFAIMHGAGGMASGESQPLKASSIFGQTQSFGSGGDFYHGLIADSLGMDQLKIDILRGQLEKQEEMVRLLAIINNGGSSSGPGMPSSDVGGAGGAGPALMRGLSGILG